jgi:hypothetical protein
MGLAISSTLCFYFFTDFIVCGFKTLFGKKMDGTGGSECAVYVRVSAFKTLFAQIIVVLHAFISGFPFRMKFASAHFFSPHMV